MSGDAKTLAVYAAEAARYADFADSDPSRQTLERFLSGLPEGAFVLDLGCGPGHAARQMLDAGIAVDAVDASPEMIAEARTRFGVPARVARFKEIDAEAIYDGVWASFSLLHAPKAEMPGHLARLRRALKPGGRLAIGLKTGEGERRDALGRFYAYYQPEELDRLLTAAGFTVTGRVTGADAGLDGTVAPWMVVYANG